MKFGQWDFTSHPKLEVNGYRLEVSKTGAGFKYSREYENQAVENLLSTPKEPSLGLYPTKPLGLFETVTCILLRLKTEALIPPDGSVQLELTCPFDLAVIITEDDHNWVVDRFPIIPAKYSLYGPPERGIVGRYHISTQWDTLDEKAKDTLALLTLKASNRHHSWIRFRTVVIPMEQIDFFHDKKQAYTEVIELEIKGRMLATVSATNDPPRDGLRRSPVLSPEQNKVGFDMEWGY